MKKFVKHLNFRLMYMKMQDEKIFAAQVNKNHNIPFNCRKKEQKTWFKA